MRAVIMAGGKGMRLRPYTSVLPKPLMPLGEIPILEIILRQLAHFGCSHVTLTLNYGEKLIRNFFGDGSQLGLKIDYTIEQEPMGSIGSLKLVGNIKEPFILMNADILTDLDFNHLYQSHIESTSIATLVVTDNRINIEYGVIETNKQGEVLAYLEKPTLSQKISSGIYVLNPEVAMMVQNNEEDFPELIMKLIQHSRKVETYFHSGYWKDIGTFKEYCEANRHFSQYEHIFMHKSAGSKNDKTSKGRIR
jgi:NDP-mannose synthase